MDKHPFIKEIRDLDIKNCYKQIVNSIFISNMKNLNFKLIIMIFIIIKIFYKFIKKSHLENSY